MIAETGTLVVFTGAALALLRVPRPAVLHAVGRCVSRFVFVGPGVVTARVGSRRDG